MDNYNAEIYCMSAKMQMRNLSDNYGTGIKEEASQWKIHFTDYSFDDVRDLVITCVRKNVLDMNWNEYDVDGVAWFTGIYSTVAIQSGLVCNFDSIFKASFLKYFSH